MTRPEALPKDRLEVFWAFLFSAGFLIALRLFHLQVLMHRDLLQAAEKNRTQLIFTAAPRGRIVDRRGRLLAGSQATFSLVYLPAEQLQADETRRLTAALAPFLKDKPERLEEVLRRSGKRGAPVRLAQGLSREAMFRLSEFKTLFSGIQLVVEAQRHYPLGGFASHLLGHLGDVDARSWETLRDQAGYRMDSKIGRAGLEKLFENDLRGEDGGILLEVDAQGRLKRLLRRIDSSPGRDLTLTVDASMQQAAEDALRASPSGKGAVVALDPANGDVLAIASIPDFDPNAFVGLPTGEGGEGIRNVPEFNLAIQGTFPPGSVFKIVTAAAAFEEGRADPKRTVLCTGEFRLGDRVFKCWKKEGHGLRDFWSGLQDSCDIYFYTLGLQAGGSLIEKYAAAFGVGQLTHLPLPGEAKGNTFGPRSRAGMRPRWRQGDTVNLSVGQGGLLATPLQMASLIAAVATRGTVYRPRLVSRVAAPDGSTLYTTQPEPLFKVDLSTRTWDLVQQGLERVVEAGTGQGARIAGLTVGGKTGTAQNPHGEDHAWFVAYAGPQGGRPQVAVAVLVQHGGHGSVAAVPVARRVIQAYFASHPPTPS